MNIATLSTGFGCHQSWWRRSLLTCVVGGLISGCGELSQSEYTEPERPADTASDDSGTDTPGFSGSFSATGVPACVVDHFGGEDQLFSPPAISETLSDYAEGHTFSTTDDYWNLVDLLLRDIIDAESGFVDYSKLGGSLAVQWQLIADNIESIPPPSGGSDSELIAYWTNMYNIVMMRYVVDRSITDVSDGHFDVFPASTTVGTFSTSLDGIEKGILGLAGRSEDSPAGTEVATIEPRLHFALNCAAKSCPPLRPFLYRADGLEQILNENTYMFFNSSLHVQSLPFSVSNLFTWFAVDFVQFAGGDEQSNREGLVDTWVLPDCRDDGDALKAGFGGSAMADLDVITYDWQVNAQE